MRSIVPVIVLFVGCGSATGFDVGETVVAISEAPIQRDGVKVDTTWIGQDLRIGAKDGDLLWVNNDHPGWIHSREVRELGQAVELFSDLIQQNPNASHLYNARGNTLMQIQLRDRPPIVANRGEDTLDFDKAILLESKSLYFRNRGLSQRHQRADALKDLDEAIRLSPTAANYADRGAIHPRESEEAARDFEEAVRLDPTSTRPYVIRARRAGFMEPSDEWSEVLKRDQYYDEAHVAQGKLWVMRGQRLKALLELSKAIEINPRNATAFEDRGLLKLHLRQFPGVISDYNAAEALGARFHILQGYRARAWKEMGDFEKAIEDYTKILGIDRNSASLLRQRGECYRCNGQFDLAIKDFERSIQIASQTKSQIDEISATCNNLAWLYATCSVEKFRDGQKALELAKKACDANSGGSPFDHDTLAAAYAESGDFVEAVKYQQKAVETAPENKLEAYQQRLELYKKQTPYRDQ